MAAALEQTFSSASESKQIQGAVLFATDTTGKFNFAKNFGIRVSQDGSEKPLELDSILFLASNSKLITTIAVLQCVEKGLVKLDEDLARISPHFGEVGVLTHFDEARYGQPNIEEKRGAVTLRHLLTHTSGIVYDSMNLKLVEYRKTQGTQPYTGPTVETRFSYPLMYEPGSLWTYGAGMDWAGRIVELITDSTLEDYMQESLFKPLGIRDITFWPRKKGLDSRMVDLHPDDPTGAGIAVGAGMNVHNNSEACFGGQGLYGAGSEFIKIMSSILANDGKLLKKETVDLMFEPHLPYGGRESMRDFLKTEQGLAWFGCNTPRDALRDWGYGGLLQLEAVEGWPYGAKTLTWGGGVNSAWFIDRANGLCGFVAPQHKMPLDFMISEKMKAEFKSGIYKTFAEWKEGQ